MTYTYKPRGVCSRLMEFDIEDGVLRGVKISGGCSGNLQGISKLITGKPVAEIIETLRGIDCAGRGTSCPDQIARALEQFQLWQK